MKNLMGKVNMKMRENRRNGRKALKGFTLVEIIVVLVILAILAAAMIPALTGYIDKARDRTIVAEARNVVTAAQTLASEAYGLGRYVQDSTRTGIGDGKADSSKYTAGYGFTDMLDLAEASGNITSIDIQNGKVVALTYQALGTGSNHAGANGKSVSYSSSTGFGDPS